MANIGDKKIKFGRQYIYLNPTPSVAGSSAGSTGHWRLALDDSVTPPVSNTP